MFLNQRVGTYQSEKKLGRCLLIDNYFAFMIDLSHCIIA